MKRHPTHFPLIGAISVVSLLALMATAVLFGPAAFDNAQMLRAVAAGNLTATEATPTSVKIWGTPARGVEVRVHVPQATGTSPTFDLKIQESSDNSTWVDLVVFKQITVAGEYRRRVTTSFSWVRYVATIGGTTPNFGIVQIGFEAAGEQSAF